MPTSACRSGAAARPLGSFALDGKRLRTMALSPRGTYLAFAVCNPATADALSLKGRFQSELDALRDQYQFPGATAAYMLPDGTVEVVASGLADVESAIPMTPQSRMLAASIGKTFVGATVHCVRSQAKES